MWCMLVGANIAEWQRGQCTNVVHTRTRDGELGGARHTGKPAHRPRHNSKKTTLQNDNLI
jgi:hypothetical protein